jgi:hypothetical protein
VTLLIDRRFVDLDHLAIAIHSTVLAYAVRLSQLAALRARHKRRRLEALMLATIAATMA